MSLKSAANESTKTRETLLIVLFILIALAPACVSKAALNHTNLTDSSADKKKAGEGKEIPAARNGYVISQTGTEK